MKNELQVAFDSVGFAEEYLVAKLQSRLQEILDDQGLTRSDLARRMDVSKARVSQIFSDEANITIKALARACFALNVDPSLLFAMCRVPIEHKSLPATLKEDSKLPECFRNLLELEGQGKNEGEGFRWDMREFAFGSERSGKPPKVSAKRIDSAPFNAEAANDWSAPVGMKIRQWERVRA